MSALNTSFNYNAAAADAARQAFAQSRVGDDAVASQLRASLNESAGPGTTITARFEYKVAQDGSLYPTETRITTETVEQSAVAPVKRDPDRRPGYFARSKPEDRQQTFGDLAKPKANLSPSDEAEIFAASELEQPAAEGKPVSAIAGVAPQAAQAVAAAKIQGEAQDEDGAAVEVEILSPPGQEQAHAESGAAVVSLGAKAQANVAGLYARNNDVVYSITPLARLAA